MSLKHFGDLRAGGGTGLQDFTAYGEQDGDLKLSYSLSGQQNVVLAVTGPTEQCLQNGRVVIRPRPEV